MHSSLNFFHVSLLYAVSWIFLLQWVSHSHFQLAELPYAHRKGFIIRNVLCKIDSRVACKGGGQKKKPLLSAPASETEGSCGGGWSKVSNHSNGPRVLMRPVYLCGNGFVCGPNQRPPPSRRNIEGLAPFTFCCPGHLFWLGNEVLHPVLPRIIDTVSS